MFHFPLLLSFDSDLYLQLHQCSNSILTCLAWAITSATKFGLLWWIAALLLWMRGQRKIATQLALVLLLAIIEAAVLKTMIMRPRPALFPDTLLNLPMPEMMFTEAEKYSFPSGHTVISGAVAYLLLLKYRDWRGVVCFLFAALVGLSRIYEGLHWPSDVIAGLVLALPPALAVEPIANFVSKRLQAKIEPAEKSAD